MAVFLYRFYDKKVISVEENKGVTIFLYTFLKKMGESVEENKGVAIFLPFIGEKSVIGVEENAGVAIFLYTFRGNPGFSVEENRGVAIFLPLFDKNVIFGVEENAGVPVFLYSFDQIASERPQCGVGLRPTDWKKAEAPLSGALPFGMKCGRKSGPARLALFFCRSRGAAGGRPTALISMRKPLELARGALCYSMR